MKQKVLRIASIVLTIGIMALIFFFSSQTSEQSAGLSRGLVRRFINWIPFTAHASHSQKEWYILMIHNLVRKGAHFTLYASLGFSAAMMFTANNPQRKKKYMCIGGIALCCVYAATDEFHQGFVAGRGPMISDVMLDTVGGAFGAAVFVAVIFLYRFIKKRRLKT